MSETNNISETKEDSDSQASKKDAPVAWKDDENNEGWSLLLAVAPTEDICGGRLGVIPSRNLDRVLRQVLLLHQVLKFPPIIVKMEVM
jgi:hypothetical protein